MTEGFYEAQGFRAALCQLSARDCPYAQRHDKGGSRMRAAQQGWVNGYKRGRRWLARVRRSFWSGLARLEAVPYHPYIMDHEQGNGEL